MASTWYSLPTEMKLTVVDLLDFDDVRSLATADRRSYSLCVPSLFKHVNIPSYEDLQAYLSVVPRAYSQCVRKLSICTKAKSCPAPSPSPYTRREVTEAITELLSRCSHLEHLTLNLESSLSKSVIPHFAELRCLSNLCINHCGDEQNSLLSERLVVSMAASIPNLTQLSLDRIARSVIHAPELVGVYPFIPLVAGDEDIPDHPILGSELRLPSLLRLPALKKLRIRDTHLGDPHWACAPVHCALEVLDLGSCYHESLDFNRVCTERIMGNVGHTVDECALSTALSPQTFAFAQHPDAPLRRLRKVHLTPLFPVENVVDTLTTLAGSPVEQLAVQCHEDDVLDMCSALEDFLSLRAERGEQAFYQHLSEITVRTVSDLADGYFGPFAANMKPPTASSLLAEHVDAIQRLQDYLRDIRRAGDADSAGAPAACNSAPDNKEEKSVPPVSDTATTDVDSDATGMIMVTGIPLTL